MESAKPLNIVLLPTGPFGNGAFLSGKHSGLTGLASVCGRDDDPFLHLVCYPLNRFGQLRIVIVESLSPRAIVKFEPVGDSKMAPFDLSPSVNRTIRDQP